MSKSKVSATDTTQQYLEEKIIAGTNVTVDKVSSGGVETLVINVADTIDESLIGASQDAYTLKVDSDDAEANFLANKLVAGDNVELTTVNNGGVKTLRIDVLDMIDESLIGASQDSYQVKVSGDDTTPNFLYNKLVAGTNIELVKNGCGGDETITINASDLDLTGLNETVTEHYAQHSEAIDHIRVSLDGYSEQNIAGLIETEQDHHHQVSVALGHILVSLDGYNTNITEHYNQQGQINQSILQALDGYVIETTFQENKNSQQQINQSILQALDGYGQGATEAEHWHQQQEINQQVLLVLDGYAQNLTVQENKAAQQQINQSILQALDGYVIETTFQENKNAQFQINQTVIQVLDAYGDNLDLLNSQQDNQTEFNSDLLKTLDGYLSTVALSADLIPSVDDAYSIGSTHATDYEQHKRWSKIELAKDGVNISAELVGVYDAGGLYCVAGGTGGTGGGNVLSGGWAVGKDFGFHVSSMPTFILFDPLDNLYCGYGIGPTANDTKYILKIVRETGDIEVLAGGGASDLTTGGTIGFDNVLLDQSDLLSAVWDPTGANAFYATGGAQRIVRYDLTAREINLVKDLNADGYSVIDIAFSPDGQTLYFTDSTNDRVCAISNAGTGTISWVAGDGVGYAGDGGPALEAKINNPGSITVDDDGNIYFSDLSNAVIRKIDTSGLIHTVVSTSGTNMPLKWSHGKLYTNNTGGAVLSVLDGNELIPIAGGGATTPFDGIWPGQAEISIIRRGGIGINNAGIVHFQNTDIDASGIWAIGKPVFQKPDFALKIVTDGDAYGYGGLVLEDGYSNTTYASFKDGYVGIGTAQPNARLTVDGVISLRKTDAPQPSENHGKLYYRDNNNFYLMGEDGVELSIITDADISNLYGLVTTVQENNNAQQQINQSVIQALDGYAQNITVQENKAAQQQINQTILQSLDGYVIETTFQENKNAQQQINQSILQALDGYGTGSLSETTFQENKNAQQQINQSILQALDGYTGSGGYIDSDGYAVGPIMPNADNVYKLGDPSYRWKNLYTGEEGIHLKSELFEIEGETSTIDAYIDDVGTINTVVGNGSAARTDGTGTAAQVTNVWALDHFGGKIFFGDADWVRYFDIATNVVASILDAGVTQVRGIGCDPTNGEIYYCATDLHQVYKTTTGGAGPTLIAGTGSDGNTGDGGAATSATLKDPWGVAVHSDGTVYICDLGAHRVRKIVSGTISNFAGSSGGTSGNTGDGGAATSALLNQPRDIRLDRNEEYLYICDTGNHRIRRVNLASGTITNFAGNSAGTSGNTADGGAADGSSINQPGNITFDGYGNAYFTNFNSTIKKVNTTGNLSTVAGLGANGFSGDGGNALAALLGLGVDQTTGICGLPTGNTIFFGDGTSERIRKVSFDFTPETTEEVGGGNIFRDYNLAVANDTHNFLIRDGYENDPETLMSIDSEDGYVGLGTGNPTAALDLQNMAGTYLKIIEAGTTASTGVAWIRVDIGGVQGYLQVMGSK